MSRELTKTDQEEIVSPGLYTAQRKQASADTWEAPGLFKGGRVLHWGSGVSEANGNAGYGWGPRLIQDEGYKWVTLYKAHLEQFFYHVFGT